MVRVFGLFDTLAQAEDATRQLVDTGIAREAIMLGAYDRPLAEVAVGAPNSLRSQPQQARPGSTFVSVSVPEEQGEAVRALLRSVGAHDLKAAAEADRQASIELQRGAGIEAHHTPGVVAHNAPGVELLPPAGRSEEIFDPLGLNWAESSKFGTGLGALAGVAAGAAVGIMGGLVGAVFGAIAGGLTGTGLGALLDVAGESFAPARAHEPKHGR
jgi:hypothetical protein